MEISFIEQKSIQQATVISKGKSIIKNEVIVEEELDESVNKIRQGKKQTFRTPNRDQTREYSRQNPHKSENLCYRCGAPFDRNHMKYCRALGNSCYNCGGKDHLSNVCKKFKKTLQFLENQGERPESNEENEVFALIDKNKQLVHNVRDQNKPKVATIKINNSQMHMVVDSGSPINCIDSNTFARLKKSKEIALKTTKRNIYSYGNDKPLRMIGRFDACLESAGKITVEEIFVVYKINAGNLLGLKAATELDLLQVANCPKTIIKRVAVSGNVIEKVPIELATIVDEFSDILHGKGKVCDYECKLKIDTKVKPVYQRLRRQPFHLRKAIKIRIAQLERDDIIEKVETPQEWMSNIVVTPKTNV